MNTVENYTATSNKINVKKQKILASLTGLHDDLAALASLERALEVERLKGEVPHGGGLKTAGPDMVAPLNKHGEQVQIPTLQIWSRIDEAISLIYQNTNTARSELPALFARSNRIEDLTKG